MEEDLDEEAKKRRKAESVEWRNRKHFAGIFMLCATVFEILAAVVSMCVLFAITLFIMLKFFNLRTSPTAVSVFEILSIVIFIAGFYLGFKIYKAVAVWAIKNFNLAEKLPAEVVAHYQKKSKEEKEEELRK